MLFDSLVRLDVVKMKRCGGNGGGKKKKRALTLPAPSAWTPAISGYDLVAGLPWLNAMREMHILNGCATGEDLYDLMKGRYSKLPRLFVTNFDFNTECLFCQFGSDLVSRVGSVESSEKTRKLLVPSGENAGMSAIVTGSIEKEQRHGALVLSVIVLDSEDDES